MEPKTENHELCDHEFVVSEEFTGGTDYVCKKCGIKKMVSALLDCQFNFVETSDDESEYVMFNPNITTILYSDTLRLTVESTGKTVQFQKNVVEVGRDKTCDFLLDGKLTVARRHATFFYEKNMWFVRDNFSTNGTWINGAKIEPGKKYQLTTNDEINFAMGEQVIFDKHEKPVQPTGDMLIE